jgi:hypothetical protein
MRRRWRRWIGWSASTSRSGTDGSQCRSGRPAAARRSRRYLGDAERLSRETVHAGPLREYLPEHQTLYRKHV